MQYVNFGTTGLQISRLGFGGIPIQRIDQPGTRELLIAAHKAGINYIDTARAYTVSEAWIGQSLEEAGLRDDFILATKCRALTKADMEAEIATSLKNLRTDHIELFQFHNPSLDGLKTILAPGGAMEALLEAKARGIVGHIGITAHLAAVFEAALDIPEIETIMFPYNIVEQQGRELIDRCAAAGKGFIDMKPLAGGAIEDGRLALRYVLSNPAVTVSIPGMATVEELNANVAGAANIDPLTPEEEAACQAVRDALFWGHESTALAVIWTSPLTRVAEGIARAHLHQQVKDPWLRRQLTPKQQSEILALGIPGIMDVYRSGNITNCGRTLNCIA